MRRRGGRSPSPAFLTLLFLLSSWSPVPLAAQTGDAALGAVLGTAGGTLVSLGVVTAQARAGRYVFSPGDVTWQLAPVGLGGVAGGLLGHRNPDRLGATVRAGAWGVLAGAVAGGIAGRLAWTDAEGVWAGAVMGASAGLLAGSLAGLLTWDADDPPILLSLSLPL